MRPTTKLLWGGMDRSQIIFLLALSKKVFNILLGVLTGHLFLRWLPHKLFSKCRIGRRWVLIGVRRLLKKIIRVAELNREVAIFYNRLELLVHVDDIDITNINNRTVSSLIPTG